jgi:enamine deaminase RidA (YjgF/YER057c/UK114 family)
MLGPALGRVRRTKTAVPPEIVTTDQMIAEELPQCWSLERVTPQQMTPPRGAYSQASILRLGSCRLVSTSAQLPIDKAGNVVSRRISDQTFHILNRLSDLLTECGTGLHDLVRVDFQLTSRRDFERFNQVRNAVLADIRPASSLTYVRSLPRRGCRVQVIGQAFQGKGMSSAK